jgi:hypothetical protein
VECCFGIRFAKLARYPDEAIGVGGVGFAKPTEGTLQTRASLQVLQT